MPAGKAGKEACKPIFVSKTKCIVSFDETRVESDIMTEVGHRKEDGADRWGQDAKELASKSGHCVTGVGDARPMGMRCKLS